jgi:hypothetical protein
MRQFLAGWVLKFFLGRLTREPAAVAPGGAVGPRHERASSSPRPDAPPGRSPLTVVMLGSLALGLPLMLIFENTFTRIAGVLLCFAFIISGVFVIANPSYLGREED